MIRIPVRKKLIQSCEFSIRAMKDEDENQSDTNEGEDYAHFDNSSTAQVQLLYQVASEERPSTSTRNGHES